MFKKLWFLQAEAPEAGGGDGQGSSGDAGGNPGAAGNAGGGDAGGSGGKASGGDPAGPAAGGGSPDGQGQAIGPDNWRQVMAKGDAKRVERLSRYATPDAVADALLATQEKIGRGELRSNTPFPATGTPDEQKAWRQSQGLPESPDKYELKLKEGYVVGAEDKPMIDAFLGKLHSANASPAVASAAVDYYYEFIEQETAKRLQKDTEQVQQSRDSLIAEMGLPEFKQNEGLVLAMIETMPAEVKDLFKAGRLADGTPLFGGNAKVFKGLADWARKINPVTALVPGAGANTATAINDEIAKYEKMMRDDSKAWFADDKAQKRYQELVAARERSGT